MSDARAKLYINTGVVTNRSDIYNVLRPLLKQTVTYTYYRGNQVTSTGTGWVERIVVDLGTSTNFDVVSAEGAYIGGAIAPGLGLSLEALVGYASKLPRIDLQRPPHAIGANTVHAMQSGTVLGYIGLVSGLLTALRGELIERSPAGSRVTVIATGGYTYETWLREVPGIDAIEPDLTLRGIRYAWERIRGTAAPARGPAEPGTAER